MYGRAYKGERCYDLAPTSLWGTTTVLATMRIDGTTESIVFEGATDRKMFDTYIEEMLAPTLQPDDIVIMDNLSSHKSQKAQEIIENKLARLMFLPPYSPDLNPIENMWSKFKQIIRTEKPRTNEELFNSVASALSQITPNDAKGWYKHCGYIK